MQSKLLAKLLFRLVDKFVLQKREPDFIIGRHDDPYLLRWWIRKKKKLNAYVHRFLKSDWDRALHDHPWYSISILIKGSYKEETSDGIKEFKEGSIIFRKPTTAHRVILESDEPVYTLFMTGPKIREWGFWCPKGWIHWKDFVDETDHGNIGKGCPE